MNGFTNAILTLLLGWVRMMVNRIWVLITSESGGIFYTFLARHWLTIVVVLCVAGFLVDKIIYIIRWRPYYVWNSRKQRLEYDDYDQSYGEAAYAGQYAPDARSSQGQQPEYDDEPAVYAPIVQEAPPLAYDTAQPAMQDAYPASTRKYPSVQAQKQYAAYAPAPHEDELNPVFDDDPALWQDAAAQAAAPLAQDVNPAAGMYNQYGKPVAEPAQYIHDVQSGFARPLPPEQLYSPTVQQTAGIADAEPVHPGLDIATFRRNFGLEQGRLAQTDAFDGDLSSPQPISSAYEAHEPAPAFSPFTAQVTEEQNIRKSRNPFLKLARLVGDDEVSKPTIHDLHNTVDVRTAFRDPVFPQSMYHSEEEKP